MAKLLTFVPKDNPILREIMPPVKDFNDPLLHQLIEDMCYSIRPEQLKAANGAHDNAAGMAANQWGVRKRVFIYTPDGSEEEKRLEVMINPKYIPYLKPGEKEPAMAEAYEGCFSVPLTTGVVNRYESIYATYYTPQGKKVEKLLHGWDARVFQHETDHLDGKLFDGRCDHFAGPECVDRVIFKDHAEMEAYWEKLRKEEQT